MSSAIEEDDEDIAAVIGEWERQEWAGESPFDREEEKSKKYRGFMTREHKICFWMIFVLIVLALVVFR